MLMPASNRPTVLALQFAILFAFMLRTGFAVVAHCKPIAARVGEPYGTLLGTLSNNSIEVATITALILHGQNNPTLLRDTLLATVMIVLCGLLGAALVVGAWQREELTFNLQGANSYLSVLVPLTVLSLLLPGLVNPESGASLDGRQTTFLMIMAVALYAVFLKLQVGRHREYFIGRDEGYVGAATSVGLMPHVVLLVCNIAAAAILAVKVAPPIDYFLEEVRLNPILGGVIVALLGSIPEANEAVRAAREDRLQHAMNIVLGSALATIAVTLPAILLIAGIAGRSVQLAVQGGNALMLLLALAMCVITFASGRTTALQGAVHLLLFGAYLLLVSGL